ncbi:hypothetical protein [Verrucomicrobium spinosum]|uniref:hypothetical protein n=1 Tax=Verrucomicrobium spinosum TaxID=2736 RepID=UPI0001745C0B|nr:hypothetical protein [Verrucomicrobium spinosum]
MAKPKPIKQYDCIHWFCNGCKSDLYVPKVFPDHKPPVCCGSRAAFLGHEFTEPRQCRVCHCTDMDCHGCTDRTGKACHWVAADLCSACVLSLEGTRTADMLVNTSVDDCRSSLVHTHDPATIVEAIRLANAKTANQKSRIKLLEAKLKQLRK